MRPSVVLESLHPLGPIGQPRRTDVFGPLAVPFEQPQLLEPDFAEAKIKEEAIEEPGVVVHAEPTHVVALTGVELAIPGRRFVPDLRPAVQAVGTQKQRNGRGLRGVLVLPVLMLALAGVGLDPPLMPWLP